MQIKYDAYCELIEDWTNWMSRHDDDHIHFSTKIIVIVD